LEIQLSRGKGWCPINRFNHATILCLFQSRTWISNVICHGCFCVQWVQLRWEVIVRYIDIGEIEPSLFKVSFHNKVKEHSFISSFHLTVTVSSPLMNITTIIIFDSTWHHTVYLWELSSTYLRTWDIFIYHLQLFIIFNMFHKRLPSQYNIENPQPSSPRLENTYHLVISSYNSPSTFMNNLRL
jgi:hypothetical protein